MDRLVIQPQPTVMTASQHFAQVPSAQIERSTFDRSHALKTTFDAGYLIPVLVDEMLPGDTFHCNMSAFARLATPLKPLMDNMFLDSFFFFVPNRLLWKHWREMNGQQKDPNSSTVYTVPSLDLTGSGINIQVGDLADYFGLPLGIYTDTCIRSISALPFRAYQLCWNEFFRDQNLQDSVPFDDGDGPDDLTDYILLRRGKRKDYFTGSLPWPQKGNPVLLPLGSHAPVVFGSVGYGKAIQRDSDGDTWGNLEGADVTGVPQVNTTLLHSGGSEGSTTGYVPLRMVVDMSNAAAYADLANATAATINAIRTAFQMQRLLERDARGGTRYTEIIRAHFGVVSPDARLQRPELLGTGESRVNIQPVAQTSEPTSGKPLGQLAAYGTVVCSGGHGFTYSATEHGIVLGLVSVRADLNYQYGINKLWSRSTRYDFYWPALAHLGEQKVLNQEIFLSGLLATNETEWGYQERYAEYRYKPSMITGLFRSNAAGTLDLYHLALDNKTDPGQPTVPILPVLGDPYIQDDPPIDRVIAVPSQPHFIMDCFFSYRCARPMPVYSVPGLVDHF